MKEFWRRKIEGFKGCGIKATSIGGSFCRWFRLVSRLTRYFLCLPSSVYVKPVFLAAKILSIRRDQGKDSHRGWKRQRQRIGWKSAMETRKTLQREQTEERGEKRRTLWVEFPLLFDLPTRAFCFLTADVALEIKDLKHTAHARGGGSFLLSSFRHRFFLSILSSSSSFPNRPWKNCESIEFPEFCLGINTRVVQRTVGDLNGETSCVMIERIRRRTKVRVTKRILR